MLSDLDRASGTVWPFKSVAPVTGEDCGRIALTGDVLADLVPDFLSPSGTVRAVNNGGSPCVRTCASC